MIIKKSTDTTSLIDKSRLYRLIVETANEGVWLKNADHITTFVNAKMAEILGYRVEEMIGKSFFNFVFPEDEARIRVRHKERQEGIYENYEMRFKHKNGDVVWTSINASPLKEGSEFIGSMGMISDITDDKIKEKLRDENERRYKSLFEDSPVPTWEEDFSMVKAYIDELKNQGVKDIRNFFLSDREAAEDCAQLLIVNDVNAAVVKLNEAPDKAYLIQNFRKLSDEKSIEYAIIQFEAIAKGENSCEFDAELSTFAGNTIHVHLKWTVVKGFEDTYGKVYLTTTDLTDRILAENERLKNSNHQKEILLKEIHHRVKNNLQIISSLLRLQANSSNDAATNDLFEISLHRINSMSLVHDLLYRSKDFSQINYSTYLNTLLETLVESLKPPGCSIELEVNAPDIQLNINTSILLGLLINEIITNSLKHAFYGMSNGKIYISISHLGADKYKMDIGDNGCGFQLESDLLEIDSLGLQLVHSLADQLYGTITKCQKGRGTCYNLEFSELIQRPLNV